MNDTSPRMLGRLDDLRAELADLAFALERRGRLDAADVANAASARIGELREEFAAPAGAGAASPTPE